uniref:Uncharacterized protein n=1 Tax=Oryza brachyantha TaxID=4533 RepID=J3N8H3_ORYBR
MHGGDDDPVTVMAPNYTWTLSSLDCPLARIILWVIFGRCIKYIIIYGTIWPVVCVSMLGLGRGNSPDSVFSWDMCASV